jgi:hypothetical protein
MELEEVGTEEIVDKFRKNAREIVCIGLSEWHGETWMFVRIYVPSVDYEGAYIRTKKGVSLPANRYAELRDAIDSLGEVFSPETVVAALPKGENSEIRVGFNEYKGQRLIFLRTFLRPADGGAEWIPTQKGVSLKVEQYPRLLDGVLALGERLGETQQRSTGLP